MLGADIAIGYLNLKTGQGIVQDYNVDAKAPVCYVVMPLMYYFLNN